ncbi:MAG: leucine-rich repeat protein [Ruminococcus sp.]|nr:leucine-rich repeat protein [Ruminococcus sp.]
MKKITKRLTLIAVSLMLAILSIASVAADTVYTYYDLKYTIVNNFSVAIAGCTDNVTDISIPAQINQRDVVSISNRAFMNNSSLTSVNLSKAKKLTRIGMFAFYGCSGLSGKLTFPDSVESIDSCAFEGCSGIESVVFNNTVTSIPNQCFTDCSSLSSVTLGNKIESIGNYAFANCQNLEYIEIGNNVQTIANSAFNNNDNLVIGVYKDSFAHGYVKDRMLDHIVLDGGKLGDVNGDGVVDILDATAIQKYAAESTDFTDEQFELGDINKDGYCNVIDALLVQKSVIGAYELPQNIIRY